MSSGSMVFGPARIARRYGKSVWWARKLLREWRAEQTAGGPMKVFVRKKPYADGELEVLYTTAAVLDQHMPRGRDEALERRLASMEKDLDRAFGLIADLQRRIGARR